MFYCDSCAAPRGWPVDTFSVSRGPCEICHQVCTCNDVPSRFLPIPPKQPPAAPVAKPAVDLTEFDAVIPLVRHNEDGTTDRHDVRLRFPAGKLESAKTVVREIAWGILTDLPDVGPNNRHGWKLAKEGTAVEPVTAAGPFVTKSGRVLTDEDIQRLADEAETGYDVAKLRPSPRREG